MGVEVHCSTRQFKHICATHSSSMPILHAAQLVQQAPHLRRLLWYAWHAQVAAHRLLPSDDLQGRQGESEAAQSSWSSGRPAMVQRSEAAL